MPGRSKVGEDLFVHMELSADLPNAMQTHAAKRVMQLAAGFGNVYLCHQIILCAALFIPPLLVLLSFIEQANMAPNGEYNISLTRTGICKF